MGRSKLQQMRRKLCPIRISDVSAKYQKYIREDPRSRQNRREREAGCVSCVSAIYEECIRDGIRNVSRRIRGPGQTVADA